MGDNLLGRRILGINGMGRIGKLVLWNQLAMGHFDSIVINTGREVGRNTDDIIQYLTHDSTYGRLDRFLYGRMGNTDIVEIIDADNAVFSLCGTEIRVLRENRNPRDIDWAKVGVRIVIDCTGIFLDPTLPADYKNGSLRGHLEAGAEKVIVSAPFKIGDSGRIKPEDCGMFVYGVNHPDYDPSKQHIISAASCTTTGLAHMVKPLLDTEATSKIITASMTTVHAATNTQSILDVPPKARAKDLRRNRSIFNNLIPTSTGAAVALEEIIPEIKKVGFMADSIRVPTTTVSLISLNLTLKTSLTEKGEPVINRELVNDIYKKAAEGEQKGLLIYSDKQNVSTDMLGVDAAIVIEGNDNHTRTGFISLDAETMQNCGIQTNQDMNMPVTHVKVFGWYDNEYGCYVNCLGRLTKYIDKNLL